MGLICGLKKCDGVQDQYYDGSDGIKYETNTPEVRVKLIQSRLELIDAHLGCNWKARKKLMKDSLNFLIENLSD